MAQTKLQPTFFSVKPNQTRLLLGWVHKYLNQLSPERKTKPFEPVIEKPLPGLHS
jgi:hypothetical protein